MPALTAKIRAATLGIVVIALTARACADLWVLFSSNAIGKVVIALTARACADSLDTSA